MSRQGTIATLIVSLLLVSGCLGDETSEDPEIEDCSAIMGDSCEIEDTTVDDGCLLYTSPSPRDAHESRMPSSA